MDMDQNQTRIYYYNDPPNTEIREAWPEKLPWGAPAIEGEKAEQIYRNAEYICVSVSLWNHRTDTQAEFYWSVHPKGKDPGDWFKVDRMSLSHDEEYPNLARTLEESSGKKGLTILVS